MPKRKKLPAPPDYKGAARNMENMLVQKANPLQTLSQTDLTLPEFKILDAYLSRIDSRKPDARFVQFGRGDLERLLGVEKIPLAELEKRLRNLFQVIRIVDERKAKGYKLIGLFEESDFDMDEYGQWQVNLCCTRSAMEYVFNIEDLGYLRYRLKNVINLTSRYSYVLYIYLENNRFRHSWETSLEELKTLLCCTAETYRQYKRFNDLILKKCCREINEKTDTKYTYEPVKRGKRVVGIRFIVETVAEQLEGQLSFEELGQSRADEDKAGLYSSESVAFLAEACDYEFSDEEMRVLLDLVRQHIPYDQHGLEHFHYLQQKYNLMQMYAAKKKINSRFNYIKAAIEKDIGKNS